MSNTSTSLLDSAEIGLHGMTAPLKEALQANWSFGALNVQLDFSPLDMKIHYSIRFLGMEIGHGTLDNGHATASAGANTPVSKADLTLTADFNKREVSVSGQVCVMVLFQGWQCTGFNTKIFSF